MVSADHQEYFDRVTAVKQVPMMKKRPAKTNAQRQAEYKARAKAKKRQLNYFISHEAYEALSKQAKITGKTKMDMLEALLLQLNEPKPDTVVLQAEIAQLKMRNQQLTSQYDAERRKAVMLQTQNEGLKLDANKLRAEITRLKHPA